MLSYFCHLIRQKLHQIIETEDGSNTLYVPGLNEHYHSVHGAVQESEHIFINCGFRFLKAETARIFEAGLGTGLNALLTAVEASTGSKMVSYTSAEKYPLGSEITGKLNYSLFAGNEGSVLYNAIHSAEWNREVEICKNFSLKKLRMDLTSDQVLGSYNIIYFDAFGPDKQPEMWTKAVFEKISSVTETGGILVTYSAKGEVKRTLQACGFEVFLLPGPPGKRQIIRAIKI
jgi:tRNA U34 5-methylaminomethyl-2-thiouridine-forming methyltransferase MnmC